jgi:hypothetical protein
VTKEGDLTMKRFSAPLLALLLLGAGAAALPRPSAAAALATSIEQRYGVVRYDATARGWRILTSPAHQNSGLTGVSCSASTGALTVIFDALTTIGTFTSDEDESYAGRYDAGASLSLSSFVIRFRKVSTGASVSCNAAELRIANSNLQLWVIGTVTT